MGRKRLCQARVKTTGRACEASPKRGSKWCVSHQDPANRWSEAEQATAAVPSLASCVARPTVSLLLPEVQDAAGDRLSLRPGDGWSVDLSRSGGRWRSTATAPPRPADRDAVEAYDQAVRSALVGTAIAETLNDGIVPPEHAEALAARVVLVVEAGDLVPGRGPGLWEAARDDTPDGVSAAAWDALALYTLDRVKAEALRLRPGERWYHSAPPTPLLDSSFYDNDPGPDSLVQFIAEPAPHIVGDWDAYADQTAKTVLAEMHDPATELDVHESLLEEYGGLSSDEIKAKVRRDGPAVWAPSLESMSCVDRTLTRLMHQYWPGIDLPIDAIHQEHGHSPVQASELSGLARMAGGDPGVFADLHEAGEAANDGALPSGLVVLSQAHRTPPGSPQYREWIRNNLDISGAEDDSTIAGVVPWVVGSVLDIVVYDESEAELARRALKDIAEETPDTFARGVREFASYGAETHEAILGALASEPVLHERASEALDRAA